jgi:HNH endonuclease
VGRFPIDHVIPRTDGGITDLSNLALACPHCNASKWKHTHGIDLMTGENAPLFNPRVTSWAQHFRWSEEDPCLIIGITACGRATVNRLRLNDAELVLIRRLLRGLGIMTAALP